MKTFHVGIKSCGRRIAAMLLPVLAGSLLLAGCGGSDTAAALGESETAAEAGTAAGSAQAAGAATAPETEAADRFAVSDPDRYIKPLFKELDKTEDIIYANAENYKGEQQDLLLDLYMPAADTETNRPVIIWLHGGGLVGGSKGADAIQKYLAADFAAKGYVSVCPDYRIREDGNNLGAALKDAMQDTGSVIQWIGEHSAEYGMSKDHIAIGGYSAGGQISINLCYDDMSRYGVEKEDIFGVIDLAGDKLYTGTVNADEPPCIIIQGTNDPKSSLEGSGKLAEMLESNGIYHVFYPIEGAGHDLTHRYDDISDQITMFLYKALTGQDIVFESSAEISFEYKKVETRRSENESCQAGQIDLAVDGKLDEWAGAQEISLGIVKDAGDGLPDSSDFEGRVMLGWNGQDPNRVYIAAVITDDILQDDQNPKKWYLNDCLELAFDLSRNNVTAPITKCVIGANGKSLAALANADNTEYIVIQEGSTYTFEAAIDVTKLEGVAEFEAGYSFKAGDVIGFSVSYNDCENGIREHQIGWTQGDASDRLTFGNLEFTGETRNN